MAKQKKNHKFNYPKKNPNPFFYSNQINRGHHHVWN